MVAGLRSSFWLPTVQTASVLMTMSLLIIFSFIRHSYQASLAPDSLRSSGRCGNSEWPAAPLSPRSKQEYTTMRFIFDSCQSPACTCPTLAGGCPLQFQIEEVRRKTLKMSIAFLMSLFFMFSFKGNWWHQVACKHYSAWLVTSGSSGARDSPLLRSQSHCLLSDAKSTMARELVQERRERICENEETSMRLFCFSKPMECATFSEKL